MRILFIAPLPPPINGQSLASEIFLKEIERKNEIKVVDMAKKRPKNLIDRLSRFIEVTHFFVEICYKKKDCDLIYLTISESFAGNIKDLFIYMLCFRRLKKMIIHMLGGAGMKSILQKKGIQYELNKFFIRQLRCVIVEGQAQATTFAEVITKDKIHIVPNFAEEFLFVSEKEVREKFSNLIPLKLLFLSNMLYGKGHNELVDAYRSLKDEIKEKVKIVFVGGFESNKKKNEFMNRINEEKHLIYHSNFISGNEKKELYMDSHIFCLPSYYPYEGQPISILEAYATGCVVVATKHSGIPDVFCDTVNGYEVEKKSSKSIKTVIENVINKSDSLLNMGIKNRNLAYNKYRTSVYKASLLNIIESSSD